jgi:hypothetical protein
VRTLEAQGSALADVVYLALLEHTQPGPYTHTESAWAREWVRERVQLCRCVGVSV